MLNLQTCTGGCYFSFLLYTLRFDGLFTVSSSRGCCPCSCCCCCCFFSSLSRFLNFFWDSFCRVRAEPVLRLYACFFPAAFCASLYFFCAFFRETQASPIRGSCLARGMALLRSVFKMMKQICSIWRVWQSIGIKLVLSLAINSNQ